MTAFQLFPLLFGALAAVPMKEAPRVELSAPEIRVADVADLSGLSPALRRDIGERVIAKLPRGRVGYALAPAGIASLVRRAAPGVELRFPADAGDMKFVLAAQAPASAGCFVLSAPVGAGEAIAAEDLAPAPCDTAAVPAAIRFDTKASALRAAGDLEAGAYLGRVAVPRAADVQAGQKLTLLSREGPVTVQRSVVALQPGRSGGRVFVRDADGEVSSAKLALADKKEDKK